mmetsp:Transcript_27261/g.74620  ORF Transcript_27261/g.74620 Transcript_27261/m.74620 type:complete len:101 (-) Transcript_27261:161-463(-)
MCKKKEDVMSPSSGSGYSIIIADVVLPTSTTPTSSRRGFPIGTEFSFSSFLFLPLVADVQPTSSNNKNVRRSFLEELSTFLPRKTTMKLQQLGQHHHQQR